MVFIDDNPTERELVKQILPDVTTPDFPIQPYDLPNFSTKLVSEYFREELDAYDVTFFNTNSYLDLYDKLFLVSKKIANNSIKSYNNSELVKQKYSKNNIISKWELILQ